MYSWENEKVIEEKDINKQLPDIMIHGIQRDRQGKLWLGTFGKGLIVFSPEGKRIMRFDTSNGMESNAVNSLYMDSQKEYGQLHVQVSSISVIQATLNLKYTITSKD